MSSKQVLSSFGFVLIVFQKRKVICFAFQEDTANIDKKF